MKFRKPSLPSLAIIVSALGPVVGYTYTVIAEWLRPPLTCNPGVVCVDVRDLQDLPGMIVVNTVFGVVGIILATIALRRKERYSVVALLAALLVTIPPLLLVLLD